VERGMLWRSEEVKKTQDIGGTLLGGRLILTCQITTRLMWPHPVKGQSNGVVRVVLRED